MDAKMRANVYALMKMSRRQQTAELKAIIGELVREIAEKVPICLESVMERVDILGESGIETTADIYQRIFYSCWLAELPPAWRDFFQKGLDARNEAAQNIRDYVLGMGSKLKIARNGFLCVASAEKPVCAECYFKKACRLAG